MFIAIKGNRKISLSSDVQATAFKKSGWDVSGQAESKVMNQPSTEMDALKEEATALGISFRSNIGYEKLLEKVEEARKASSLSAESNEEFEDEAELEDLS